MWNWWRLSFCLAPYLVFVIEWALMRLALRGGRHKVLRLSLTAGGLIAASKFIGFGLLGGDSFNPELPVPVLFLWGWLESIVWIAFPVGLAAAVWFWLLGRVRARSYGMPAICTVLSVSIALAAYGMWEGMRVPPVVEREVVLDGLPPEFEGYRVAHISDIHCSSAARRDKIAEMVGRTNAAHPDLVAITGDFVDGFPACRAKDLEPLKDLVAHDGVWAAAGNHERYWSLSAWEPYFAEWNVRMLRNSCTVIRRGSASLAVGGLDDVAIGAHPGEVFKDAPAAAFRILLFHRPIWCEANDRIHDVRLQLSGHTHGGAMPIIRHFVAGANEGHARGIYPVGRLVLHVSPGSGQWAGFPLRLFNPPEITLLVLKRGID